MGEKEKTPKKPARLLVIVPASVHPHQVDVAEDAAEPIERSVKGALHIRPASTMLLTEGELAHIEKNHPELRKMLIVADPGPSLEELLARKRAAAPTLGSASIADTVVESGPDLETTVPGVPFPKKKEK